jgi:hypothetical protein
MLITPDNLPEEAQESGTLPPGLRKRVSLRVLEAGKKDSSKGSPMIVLNCEIIEPTEHIGEDGTKYDLTSVKVPIFLVLAGRGLGFIVKKLMPKLGLKQEIDIEDPDTKQFEGLCFDALLETKKKGYS